MLHLSAQLITFRRVVLEDAIYISKWTAPPGKPVIRLHFKSHLELNAFWEAVGRPTFGNDWMAISRSKKPLFYLEIEGEDVFLRGPMRLLHDPEDALTAWERSIDHLRSLATFNIIRTTLDISREIECSILLKVLHFTELPPSLNPDERRFELIL